MEAESAVDVLEPPDRLLAAHRRLLTALRLESGYSPGDLQRLINPVLTHYAGYVYALPATRAEHHREPGRVAALRPGDGTSRVSPGGRVGQRPVHGGVRAPRRIGAGGAAP